MNNEIVEFWMVMKDDCSNYSSHRHFTEEGARIEAERLCHKEGKRFFVLKTIAYVEPENPPVKWSIPIVDETIYNEE